MQTILLACALMTLPMACSPCELDSASRSQEEKRAMLRIVLGEGGGITGLWEGHTITGDGALYAWKGRGARENEIEIGRLPADTMCVLWDMAKDLVVVPPVDSSGSLVRLLIVSSQDSTRKYTWRPQLGREGPMTPYEQLYHRCDVAIRHALTQQKETLTPSTK